MAKRTLLAILCLAVLAGGDFLIRLRFAPRPENQRPGKFPEELVFVRSKDKPEPIAIDLAPGQDVTELVRKTNHSRNLAAVRAAYRDVLPVRLADRWLDLHAPQKYTDVTLAGLERETHRWEIVPDGTEGYEKAEVTAGGIDTGELSAKTLESHKARGLYFIGEVVDVTGQLGGFNFQSAWASGFCAGTAL